jgi:hypothetical protein
MRSGSDDTIYRFQTDTQDRFWKASVVGNTLTISEGDTANPEAARIRTYKMPRGGLHLADEPIELANRGYHQIDPEEFDAAVRKLRGKRRLPDPKAGSAQTSREVRRARRPSAASRRPSYRFRKVRPAGPYAHALTGPTIHGLSFRTITRQSEAAPRATSGGRPILQEGQPWPACGYCNKRMSLYLQFDVEDRFQMSFPAGSHFLLFHCPDCRAIPTPIGPRVLAKWLRPDFPTAYRMILNPPGVREVIHELDSRLVQQRVTFKARKERITRDPDGAVVGLDVVKLGGVPHWRQPPHYPKCACGAPMGFVMQIPATKPVAWMRTRPNDLPFAGGMNAFLFACSALSSPYAGVIIPQ